MSYARAHAYPLLLALLGLFALLNIGDAFYYQFTRPEAGYDFHSYWYYGHYIRQGRDLYYPLLHNPDMLSLPVRYLDGVVVADNPVRVPIQQMGMVPVYTAPLLFFFSLFSWFSWRVAESLWFVCNLACLLAAPFLLMRLLPRAQRLERRDEWLVALSFFGWYSTRLTLAAGQVGGLILVLMFGAFALMDRAWPLAGLLLGLALSKYSLALPALVLVVLMRRFRVALLALVVQAAGFLAISSLAGGSAQLSAEAQWLMFLAHGGQEGINLSAHLLASSPLAAPALVALAALVGALLGRWLWRTGWLFAEHASFSLVSLQVFNLLGLLTLLIAYHRIYDVVLGIGFVLLVVQRLARPQVAPLSGRARQALLAFLVALLFVLTVVANVPEAFWARLSPAIPAQSWQDAQEGLVSLMLVCALFVSLWLLYQAYPQRQVSPLRVPAQLPIRRQEPHV